RVPPRTRPAARPRRPAPNGAGAGRRQADGTGSGRTGPRRPDRAPHESERRVFRRSAGAAAVSAAPAGHYAKRVCGQKPPCTPSPNNTLLGARSRFNHQVLLLGTPGAGPATPAPQALFV